VEIQLADAQESEQIRSAVSGFDAVVNVIGGGTLRRNDVASSTSAVVVRTVEAAGVKRYVAMSAGMVALDWPLFKYVLRPLIFRHILAEHNRVEAIVRASSLDWTIVRPTALTNNPPKGYAASLALQPRSFATAGRNSGRNSAAGRNSRRNPGGASARRGTTAATKLGFPDGARPSPPKNPPAPDAGLEHPRIQTIDKGDYRWSEDFPADRR
jgi:uncharacterized protein YbjT (DUF2867 family)